MARPLSPSEAHSMRHVTASPPPPSEGAGVVPPLTADECEEKGKIEFRRKNYDAALLHFFDGVAIDPNHHVLYSNRSACYASLQKWDEALADAQKCVAIAPTFIKGFVRLGQALLGKRDYTGALEAYQKGLETDPSSEMLKECIAQVVTTACAKCKAKEGLMRCATCKSVCYCCKECQKGDWQTHKLICWIKTRHRRTGRCPSGGACVRTVFTETVVR